MQNVRGGATSPHNSVMLARWKRDEACHTVMLTDSLYSNSDLQIHRGCADEKKLIKA